MAKFCSKCGNQLEENVKFCKQCGVTVEVKEVESVTDVQTQKTDPVSGKKTIGVVLAFVVVIAIIAAIGNGNKSYEKPLQYFAEGINNHDYSTYSKAIRPDELEEWGYMYEDDFEEQWSEIDNVKFKVKKSEQVVEDGVERMTLTVDAKVSAGGETEEGELEIDVVKIDGQWYLYEEPDIY